MLVRLLGTAAGGGIPQWNCRCPVCEAARAGDGRVRPRTQSGAAISGDGRRWFLLNASPDLRQQLADAPALRPAPETLRGSPLEAVLLTNADLDHTLGLLLLREGPPLRVHASPAIRESLAKHLAFETALSAFCGVEWIEPGYQLAPLLCRDGQRSGLLYEALDLGGTPPRFARNARVQGGHVLGYRFTDESTGGRLLYLPGVATMEGIERWLSPCEAVLFDGTFWTEEEMRERGVGTLSAAAMGHVPISGPRGSLKTLAALPARHKVYVHLNNTNPVLFEDSPERAAVAAAGVMVGWDGFEMTI